MLVKTVGLKVQYIIQYEPTKYTYSILTKYWSLIIIYLFSKIISQGN